MKFIILLPLLLAQMEPPSDTLAPDSLVMPMIRPATNVVVSDVANDEGNQLEITWALSPDDELIDAYLLLRMGEKDTVYQDIDFLAPGITSYTDNNNSIDPYIGHLETQIKDLGRQLRRAEKRAEQTIADSLRGEIAATDSELAEIRNMRLENRVAYKYKVAAILGEQRVESEESNFAKASGQWFDITAINVLVAMVTFFSLILIFIYRARQGKQLFLRKIAGLEEIDNAVGRATEMGRPILYVPGTSSISDIATIASLTILQGVAKKAAQYDTPIIVPNMDPIVYSVTREIVKEAFSDVGRPDAFNPDSVFFITQNQFAFVSAVNGIMLREKPATNFFLGMFYAESLLLAETGNIAGSIQIAGTDASAQLPFFITACDHTIIGEELYAASAYISREPDLIGPIKAQDWGKAIIAFLLVVLAVLAGLGIAFVDKILIT
ncbi:hypothetical protein JXM67_11320 [candidate division WOR-3 bacterium]|nr:hypothetical protein [candidate division WOR-3 bacterium]